MLEKTVIGQERPSWLPRLWQRVNGIEYDSESLEIEVAGIGSSFTMIEVNYKATKDVDVPTGRHGLPRGGVTRKKYEGTFGCTIARSEYNALAEATSDTGVLGAEPFPVTLSYGNDGDEPTEDELEVKITEIDTGSKQDESTMVKLTGKHTKVAKLAGVPVYVDPLGRAE